ncbi:MAG TPA: hypothetical protein PKY87_04970, partial [Terricaulis sp.]|nr:hypothetical protein [Terricaulis sp.]
SGLRPVEWLLQSADLNARWCLIHATHLTDAETDAFAASGACAGLCPVTEANLGDGFFPFALHRGPADDRLARVGMDHAQKDAE